MTRARTWSLSGRLTIWLAASGFLLVALTLALTDRSIGAMLDTQVERSLAEKVAIVRKLLAEQPEDVSELRHEVEWEWSHNAYAHVWLRVVDTASGAVVACTHAWPEFATPGVFPPPLAPDSALGGAVALAAPDGRPFRALSAEARIGRGPQKGQRWLVHALWDFSREAALRTENRRRLAGILALALALCMLAGGRLARHAVAPLAGMSSAVASLDTSRLSERLPTAGLPRELLDVAEAYTASLARLEESFERVSRFSADIAHELRTPLSNLRGAAEVALGRERTPDEYRELLGSHIEETDRLTDIVDRLLFLAQAESPQAGLARERLAVAEAVATICSFYAPAAEEAGVALVYEATPQLHADLDPVLLQRALSNLVSNALRHTPAGGRISITSGPGAGSVWIEVADTGPGIAPEHLPHVFERFYRVERDRSSRSGGVGLGLSIVASVARMHGGRASIRSDSAGTAVRLELRA